ncbi:hypothetical protein [Desulfovibrio sp.]|uniref:hypothetical protein n=1 Tax=Desulfovibrio sp. TaxID=885 RepID=UPI00307709E3
MRNPERVSLRPLLGGLILLLALTVIGATRFNSAEQREILDRTGSQLSAYTSTAAAMVTVWTGVQRDAVAEMARYDMLRLLAAEIAETNLPVALLRAPGRNRSMGGTAALMRGTVRPCATYRPMPRSSIANLSSSSPGMILPVRLCWTGPWNRSCWWGRAGRRIPGRC